MKRLFVLINYSRTSDVTEEFNEITIYDNYEKAKKRFEEIAILTKTIDLINKKEYEFEYEDYYEVSDDNGNVDGVYIKEVEINKPYAI